jgi:thiamine pyrophosphate-dependent acetolactate synthase large subunit-like protein
LLEAARSPLILIGRVSADPADFERRVALAERLGAVVLTDIKTGASFPTQHPLHPIPPSLYVTGAATQAIRDADVIVSLDWIDLGGTLRQACAGALPRGKIISCSLDQYVHNGWNMDYQALPPTDLAILAPPDAFVSGLLAALGDTATKPRESWFAKPPPETAEPAAPRARSRMRDFRSPSSPASRRKRLASIAPRTSASRSAGRASSAASRTRSTTSASTAPAASAPGRGWRSVRRLRSAAAIGSPSPCWAMAIT